MVYWLRMRDDSKRTAAYQRAISALAKGKVVLDLGTGGLALFAIMCAEAGAAHVYAMEANPTTAIAARREVLRAGFNETITVIEGFSTDIRELPQPVDLIVHEVFGAIASNEGVTTIVEDAKRFLKPSSLRGHEPWSIPAAAQTLVAPIVGGSDIRKTFLPGTPDGWDWHPIRAVPDDVLLGDWQVFEDLVFGDEQLVDKLHTKENRVLHWEMKQEGLLGGFAFCIRISAVPGDEPFTSTHKGSSWDNIVYDFGDYMVFPGDTLSLHATSNFESLKPSYHFHALMAPAPDIASNSNATASASPTRLPTEKDFFVAAIRSPPDGRSLF